MHEECATYVARQVIGRHLNPRHVLDIGGMNVNGSVRGMAPEAEWTSVDIKDGPGVDVVADAAYWKPSRRYDLVLCLEVFEHTRAWPQIVDTCYVATERAGGHCIMTCATNPRPPHGAYGAEHPGPHEYYQNVDPGDLLTQVDRFFQTIVDFTVLPRGDIQILARA